MAYQRKTRDEWEIQANHGQGWELETTEESRRAAREQVKTYRENVPGINIRIVKKRVKIES